jgi:hypothetical protein
MKNERAERIARELVDAVLNGTEISEEYHRIATYADAGEPTQVWLMDDIRDAASRLSLKNGIDTPCDPPELVEFLVLNEIL